MKKLYSALFLILGSIYCTNSYSQTWTTQTSGTQQNLNSIHFVDVFNGWAVGDQGTVLHTSNGGANWVAQSSGVTNILKCVYFANTLKGWAVGASGKVLSTIDGGQTWTSQTSGTSETLNCISFINDSTGWVGGNGNAVIFTNNSGTSWVSKATGFYPTTNGIYFSNTNEGWVVGNNEYIIHTVNGGTNWSTQNTAGFSLMDVVFINDSTGICVGNSGTIMKTTNYGSTWSTKITGTIESILSVCYSDENYVWAVGTNQTILNSTDAGESWTVQTNASTGTYQDIYFVDGKTGWICGNTGKILKQTVSHEICLVTVDTIFQKNKIIWERTSGYGIAYYKIYKYIGSSFDSIDYVPYSNMSEYIDFSSNPYVTTDRYKISAVDSVGVESLLSPYHQTINLSVSQGVPASTMVLQWTYYEEESLNFVPEKYYIYRGTAPGNILTVYDSVSNIVNLYNNLNVTGVFYYRVAVNKPDPCVPTGDAKVQGGPYSQSFSNLDDNGIIMTNNQLENDIDHVTIYPNPANEMITVEGLQAGTIEILNIQGRVIKNSDVTDEKTNIDISKLSSGFYTIRIKTDGGIIIRKLIKE